MESTPIQNFVSVHTVDVEILLWVHEKYDLLVALRKFRGSPKSAGFSLLALWIYVTNFMAIHPIVVEIFQSRPKWFTAIQTNITYSTSMANKARTKHGNLYDSYDLLFH